MTSRKQKAALQGGFSATVLAHTLSGNLASGIDAMFLLGLNIATG